MEHISEPDWYADPTGIHHHRYWDGARWTAHVADRYGTTSAHHLHEQYAPPGQELAPPPPSPAPVVVVHEVPRDESAPVAHAAEVVDDAPKLKRALRFMRRNREDSTPARVSAPERVGDLGETTEAGTHPHDDVQGDDALMLAAQVLQGACERSGFSWRESEMTIDDAINALPVDIADHTVGMMNRLFAAAGDEENAAWTATKLREIKTLKRGYRKLHELVSSTPKDELFERSRSFGVPDDLTEDFVAGVLGSEIPTVAELQTAQLPVGGPDAA